MGTALVTGASSGIGTATALRLAARGHHIVAIGRSERRTTRVVQLIEDAGNTAEYLHADLASFSSIRTAATSYLANGSQIDMLVNNAGVGATWGKTQDGFEIHFGINHLGHFLLTALLEDAMRPGSRLVQVSSAVHERAEGIDFDRATRRTSSFYGVADYAQSKLANILFVRELAKRKPDWRTYAVHPGLTRTNILPAWLKPFAKNLLTPDQGADTVVWCATAPEVEDESGNYYSKRSIRQPSEQAENDDLAAELWQQSEKWCGLAF